MQLMHNQGGSDHLVKLYRAFHQEARSGAQQFQDDTSDFPNPRLRAVVNAPILARGERDAGFDPSPWRYVNRGFLNRAYHIRTGRWSDSTYDPALEVCRIYMEYCKGGDLNVQIHNAKGLNGPQHGNRWVSAVPFTKMGWRC